LAKRVDFSGRSVVVGDMELKPYEIGVPYKMLAGIAEPFILHVLYHQIHPEEKKPFMDLLQEAGIPLNKFEQLLVQYRRDFLDENDPRYARIVKLLKDAIDLAVRDKWVLAKRDPALHRGSFIPMKVVPVDGYALRFPNTAIAPLGMDFDGDSVAGDYKVTLYNEKGEVVYDGPIAGLLQTDLFEPAISF
jgi:DNA-directed RNA polymerase subunit beta'